MARKKSPKKKRIQKLVQTRRPRSEEDEEWFEEESDDLWDREASRDNWDDE